MKTLKRHFQSRLALLITLTLLFTCNPMGSAIYVVGADDMNGVISVSNEEELKAAIFPAGSGLHAQFDYEIPIIERTFTIELTADIDVTETLTIPQRHYITMIGGHALKMMNNGPAINVPSDSCLTIAGITVTHDSDATGVGIHNFGTLSLTRGSISGNKATAGAGVLNRGTFNMSGGEISHNEATDKYGMGGGVCNDGVFTMSKGIIAENSAAYGAGVFNDRSYYIDSPDESLAKKFYMYGGEISGNEAKVHGGGVWNGDFFYLYGGEISENNADKGGGVWNACGIPGGFSMEGGSIFGNKAITDGGGVANATVCNMSGGDITDNQTLTGNGGGVWNGGRMSLSGGTVTGNTASADGGGIWTDQSKLDRLIVAADVTFSNNSAHTPYDRKPEDDGVYAANIKCTTWTSPFTQGYNNYDISYEGVPFKETVDTDGPVISGFIPFVTEVKAGGEVRFEIDIKDPSGLGQPQALLIPPAGSSIAPLTATLTRSTGNTFSGLWNIPANAPAGQWQIRFECADTLGNFATWNPVPVITVAGAGASGGTQSQGVTLTLDRAALTLDIGGTATLKATQKRGTVINSYPNLDWTSDRSDVATVDVYGKVTAKGPGTAIIRVVGDESATAICTVTVNAPAAEKGGGNIPDTPTGNGTTPGTSGGTDETTTSPGGNQTNGSTATATIPRVALKTVKAGKGKVTVTWKKAATAAKVTGYQIQVRVKGNVKWKTKTINAKKTSVTFKKLKTEKRYQVRIRAYRLADGKTHYGGWSKVFVSGKVR